MATLNLGRLKPVFRGAWNNATAYNVDDIVVRNNQSYISIQAGTNQDPATATAYWTLMAAAGTDVGATLTTQGDILYRDGSGLQRLAAGTNGQVLQTGGAGANPSWATLTSDFVKIAQGSSSGSSIEFQNCFSSTYRDYIIIGSNIYGASSNQGNLWHRFMTGTNTKISSGYYYRYNEAYSNGSSHGDSNTGNHNASHGSFNSTSIGGGQTTSAHFTATIYDPYTASNYKFWTSNANTRHTSNGYYYCNVGGGHTDAASNGVATGIIFEFENGGNFSPNSRISIYGVK